MGNDDSYVIKQYGTERERQLQKKSLDFIGENLKTAEHICMKYQKNRWQYAEEKCF